MTSGNPFRPARGRPAPDQPALERLQAELRNRRRRLVLALLARSASEALFLQLILLPAFAVLAGAEAHAAFWLKACLGTFLVWLWPPAALARAAWRGDFRSGRIAADLDAANPAAPDVFRTLLSLASHNPSTRRALDSLFAGWEPRLRLPPVVFQGRARRRALILAGAWAALLPLAAGAPRAAYQRMLLPMTALRAIPAPRLLPEPLPAAVPRGDTLAVRVRTEHLPPGRPVYAHFAAAGRETRRLLARRGDTASHLHGPLESDVMVWFSGGGVETAKRRVRVADPPRLRSLAAVITPPSYTRLPPESLPAAPSVLSVLPGSRVEWRAESPLPLQRLTALFRGEEGAGREEDLGGGRLFSFGGLVTAPVEMRLSLSGGSAEGSGRGVEGPYRVELRNDEPPEITLVSPVGERDLGRAQKVPVSFRVRDDYGVTRVLLRYSTLGEGEAKPAGTRDITSWVNRREGNGAGIWAAAALARAPGDVLEMHLEVIDNDEVSGPKRSRSHSVRLRLPSPAQARASLEAEERGASASLAGAIERERRLRRERERPDAAAAREALPELNEWDIRRILSDQPRRHLGELRRQLEAEARLAGTPARARPLEEIRREAEAMEKRIPDPGTPGQSLEDRKKALEALHRDQTALQHALAGTPPPRPAAETRAPEGGAAEESPEHLRQERARLEEELKNNLREQRELQAWLQDRERAERERTRREEQAARHAEDMRRDVERAMEQLEAALRKGMEDGTLSTDMLEQMDRIQELLAEVLAEDERERMRSEARDHRVDGEDLLRSLKETLDRKEGVRTGLENALRMLENMRAIRALGELAGDLRELEAAQRELAADLERRIDPAVQSARQRELQEGLEDALGRMEELSRRPGLSGMEKEHARKALEAMRNTARKLGKEPQDRTAPKAGADLAARHLQKAAEEMEAMRMQQDADSRAAEVRAVLEETLEFTRWLETVRRPAAAAAEGWGEEGAVRRSTVRLARWLRDRMIRLADARPFESGALRREAAALGNHAETLASAAPSGSADGIRLHARGAARELLKWLNQSREEGGPEEGDGEGDSGAGGGDQGDSGEEGLAGRLRGVSGKQMAVNRATQELLRSFLEGRRDESSQGGQPGARGPGESGRGDGGKPGGRAEGSGDGKTGGARGGGSSRVEGGADGGETAGGDPRGPASAQQRIAETLEHMAEAAGDGGGAARKLRELAAEARALESELRRRADPEATRRRQEAFQARLLEAAHSLEERGHRRERRGEAWKEGATDPEREGLRPSGDWLAELRRRREEARRLPLTPEQKQRVEWYYEQLMAP